MISKMWFEKSYLKFIVWKTKQVNTGIQNVLVGKIIKNKKSPDREFAINVIWSKMLYVIFSEQFKSRLVVFMIQKRKA